MDSIKQLAALTTRIIHFIEDSLLALLLGSMILLAGSQIIMRNFMNSGIEWVDPSLRVLVLWIGLVGAMVAARELNHINIDVISRFLPALGKRVVSTITNAFSSAICGIVAYHSARFVQMEYDDKITAFANVPAWVCEIIIPVGFGVMALRFLAVAISTALGHMETKPADEQETV